MTATIHTGDCRELLRTMADQSVHCCVTSPPYYGLRDYGNEGQLGLEQTPEDYVAGLVDVFGEVWRVLRDDGTLWLNLGDSYAGTGGRGPQSGPLFKGRVRQRETITTASRVRGEGLKEKDLVGIPWRVAFALQAAGWYLRQDIIWSKPNPMPESVTDRCTKAHEYLFLLSKSPRYYFDSEAIKELSLRAGEMPGGQAHYIQHSAGGHNRDGLKACGQKPVAEKRNKRSVWTVATRPFKGAHFATFPPALIEPCILAGCPAGGVVLDPFGGAGTTAMVAERLGRDSLLLELNPEYAEIAQRRLAGVQPGLSLGALA